MPEPKSKPFFKILEEKAIKQKHFKILKESKYHSGSTKSKYAAPKIPYGHRSKMHWNNPNRPKFSAIKSIKRGAKRFPHVAALLGAYEGGKWIYEKLKKKKKAKGGIIRDSFKQQYD